VTARSSGLDDRDKARAYVLPNSSSCAGARSHLFSRRAEVAHDVFDESERDFAFSRIDVVGAGVVQGGEIFDDESADRDEAAPGMQVVVVGEHPDEDHGARHGVQSDAEHQQDDADLGQLFGERTVCDEPWVCGPTSVPARR
jgi:hypothetical protein